MILMLSSVSFKVRSILLRVFACVFALGFAHSAMACGLSLILALDVSSSVDDAEFQLQRDGTANALTDPAIMQAIGDVGGIQIMAFEWSGRSNQAVMAPWAFLRDAASVFSFAARLKSHERSTDDFPTAIGYALGFGSNQFRDAPQSCTRRVIDVSGDGVNNEGFEPHSAYRAFDFTGVQVNGLVITGADPDPVGYYQTHVRYGTGAFVEIADGFSDFEAAMRRKLLREILGGAYSWVD